MERAGDESHRLFDDIFQVTKLNPHGDKKFDNVTRIVASSDSWDIDLTVDVYSSAYKVKTGDNLSILVTTTIDLDGKPDDGRYDPSQKTTLLNEYEYGMYGKVFLADHASGATPRLTIFASFGGLLMKLEGDPRQLNAIKKGQRIYLLMRKVAVH